MSEALVTFYTQAGPQTFNVEVAATDDERAHGLMCRESLGPDEGMLFLFQQADTHSFWMKNTLIPLDIVYIDDNMRVVSVIRDAEPMSGEILQSAEPGRYVVEMLAGESTRRGIMPGTTATFDGVELVDEHCGACLESTRRGTLGSSSYLKDAMTFDVYPVDPATAYVTSLFAAQEAGLRVSPHRGMDFGVPVGTPVRAVWPGIVGSAFQDKGFPSKGGGNVIFLEHPNGLRTAYLHLDRFAKSKGATVAAGDIIGYSGNTGGSTGPHLHFEVRRKMSPSDERLNPLDFFPGPLNLSQSLAKSMGVAQLHPGRAAGLVTLGFLALAGYGAYRLGKKRGWF